MLFFVVALCMGNKMPQFSAPMTDVYYLLTFFCSGHANVAGPAVGKVQSGLT